MGNNQRKNNFNPVVTMAATLGLTGGFLLSTILYPKEAMLLIIIAAIYLLASIFMLIYLILYSFVLPRIARRKAALRALGKDGIKVLRTEKTARMAYKGIYYAMGGKLAKGEGFLRQALDMADVRQNRLFCIEWLIRIYEETENDSKLMWCMRKAVEYAPDNPDAQSRLGHAYYTEGKLDQAEYCFNQAIRYDPNNGYSYFSLAKIFLIRGQDEKAFETLSTLLKINESHPLAHAELAEYYAMQADKEKAEEECKKAQLCGIKEPEELNRRINAMLSFHCTDYDGKDLPEAYYRCREQTESEMKKAEQ